MAIYNQRFFNNYNNYTVENLFVYTVIPDNSGYLTKNRPCSSIAYLLKGSFKYEFGGNEIILSPGDAIYLPKGSTYRYSVLEKDSEIIQTRFNLFCNNAPYVFSDVPVPIPCEKNNLEDIFPKLIDDSANDVSVISHLFRLFGIIKNTVRGASSASYSRLRPAVQYIRKHCCEKISISYLSSLCGLSESHFRLLFVKEFGVSPIKYKNRLVCQAAVRLMESENLSVSQIVDALGFSDIYTFSQLFKKEMGISPSKYSSQREIKGPMSKL